mmetsp:Transcript_16211/g.46141  ORF Transcript_16211/g.46141 Transcript_16211/m.46141 type:complete len:104 (-) Transcript_16211:103-414(-)
MSGAGRVWCASGRKLGSQCVCSQPSIPSRTSVCLFCCCVCGSCRHKWTVSEVAPAQVPSAAAAAAVTGEDKASPSPPITVTMPEGGEQANPNSGSPPLQAVSS